MSKFNFTTEKKALYKIVVYSPTRNVYVHYFADWKSFIEFYNEETESSRMKADGFMKDEKGRWGKLQIFTVCVK